MSSDGSDRDAVRPGERGPRPRDGELGVAVPPVSAPSGARRVFISYARADDEAFAMRLRDDLRSHGFGVWWDRASMESRGHTFLREIRDAIGGCERVLLIVGPQAGRSRYVEMEWRHALRIGAVVTPLLRAGDYPDVPEALRALHCEDVRPSVPEAEGLARVRRLVATPVPPLGPLVAVPRLPTPWIERADLLDRLRARVLIDAYQPVDLEPDQRITSLTGMGGVGKSVLAAALAQAPEVRRSFREGVIWLAVGRDAAALPTLRRLGQALDDAVDRYTGIPEARVLLERALAGRNCLLVLDDVWDVAVLEALHTAAGAGVRILLTSRRRRLFASAGVHELAIDELSPDEALELLAGWTGLKREELPPEAVAIAHECGRLPLALAMIGATLRARPGRWGHALERLRRADLSRINQKLPDYAYETLDRAMLVSFEDLAPDRQRRYLDLVAVPEDAAAPATMLERWWSHEGMDPLDAAEVLDELVERSLLRVDARQAYTLHDVQRDFLAMRVGDPAALHARWLAASEAAAPGGWAAAEDDGYLFDHLGHHLRAAGRERDWRDLLASFAWLERKARARGFAAVLPDLAAYAADEVLGPLYRACRPATHVLSNDPAQLAAQLLARLAAVPGLEPLLVEARAWRGGPWLRPRTPSLDADGEPVLAVFRGREEDGHAGTPRHVALSADGRLIASSGGSSNDVTVKVWSVDPGMLLRTYPDAIDVGGAAGLVFLAADGRFAVARRDGVSVYALTGEAPIARRTFAEAPVACLGGNGWDGVVFVALEDGRVLAWDVDSDATWALRAPGGAPAIALAHAAAAPRVAIASAASIECRSSADGSLLGRLEAELGDGVFPWQPPPLAIAPDGSKVFFGDSGRTWSIDDGITEAPPEAVLGGRVVGLGDDGAVALVVSSEREFTAIERVTGRQLGWFRSTREVACLALARDGRAAVTGDYEHDVKLWDLTRPAGRSPQWQLRGPVWRVAIGDDPELALVASERGREVWSMTTDAPVAAQAAPADDRFVRRGASLLDLGPEERVRAQLEAEFGSRGGGTPDSAGEDPVGALAFSLGAHRAVSAVGYRAKFADAEEPATAEFAHDYPLRLWDLGTHSAPRLLRGHTMPVGCIDVTTDGRRAISGSYGRLLRLWDLDEGVCLRILRGHRGIVGSCAISDDARLAVSGSEDMTVRLWDLERGELLFTFAASSAVISCDIARDGSVAIAGEASGRVHVFAVVVGTEP